MESRPLVSELFQAGKQKNGDRDMTKLAFDFSNFSNAPKKEIQRETLTIDNILIAHKQ